MLPTIDFLNHIEHTVNRQIVYETDDAHYGYDKFVADPPDGKGDCDDFAVTYRAHLLRAGVVDNAMRLEWVRLANGNLHAVLEVRTLWGVYVLDNRRNVALERSYSFRLNGYHHVLGGFT